MKPTLSLLTLLLALACNHRETPVTQQASAPASTGNTERGRQLIAQYACNVCHIVPGTQGPQGRLGPSLAGVASRPAISNGAVRNTPENLRQFITNPSSLNPQSSMPPIPLPDADARDITYFLSTLR
jgi:cytochrome c2